ncbi:MAG: hypothetical protein ACYTG0_16345 [Planctomycetota bacterium]
MRARKLVVLLMFASVAAAIVFQVMIYSPYSFTEAHRTFDPASMRELDGFLVSLIPSVIAGVICVVRMLWTMTASPAPKPSRLA